MVMIVWAIVAWWYTDGWRQCRERVVGRVDATLDYFSIGLLLRTLFSPFRQISAGGVRGPLGVQFQALIDRLFSRLIGGVLRLFIILIGGFVILLNIFIGLLLVVTWLFVPLLPFVGVVLFMIGWLPWSN